MKMCQFASFCGKRMARGDRKHGCSAEDQKSCSPERRHGPPLPQVLELLPHH